MVRLHSFIERATFKPGTHIAKAAYGQILRTSAWAKKESFQKIDNMNERTEKSKKANVKRVEDGIAYHREQIEVSKKHKALRDGKRADHIAEHLELPGKMEKERYLKHQMKVVRGSFMEHEEAVTMEIGKKGEKKTEDMIKYERAKKKQKKAADEELSSQCKSLDMKKMFSLEKRNKAIGKYKKARENAIVAKAALEQKPPYDPSKEKPHYINKGRHCQVQGEKYWLGGIVRGGQDTCKTRCSGDAQCAGYNYQNGGERHGCQLLRGGKDAIVDHGSVDIPGEKAQNCNIYEKVGGPGGSTERLGSSRSVVGGKRRLLGGGQLPAPAPVSTKGGNGLGEGEIGEISPNRNIDPVQERLEKQQTAGIERQQKLTAMTNEHNTKAEQQELEEEEKKEAKIQKENKAATIKEANEKQQVIAMAAANEKSAKTMLSEAELQVNAMKGDMDAANSEAAKADTAARHCEKEQYRRRRTCACDDLPGQKGSSVSEQLGEEQSSPGGSDTIEISQKTASQPVQANYIRRRVVQPSAVDRRRRVALVSRRRAMRMPAAVCPCCPPNEDPPSQVCVIAAQKEKLRADQITTNEAANNAIADKTRADLMTRP